jgi:hypothetical protein
VISATLTFLDESRRLVRPEEATIMVSTEVDGDDRVVKETWYRFPAGSLRSESAWIDAERRLTPPDQAMFKVDTVIGLGDRVIQENWVKL